MLSSSFKCISSLRRAIPFATRSLTLLPTYHPAACLMLFVQFVQPHSSAHVPSACLVLRVQFVHLGAQLVSPTPEQQPLEADRTYLFHLIAPCESRDKGNSLQ